MSDKKEILKINKMKIQNEVSIKMNIKCHHSTTTNESSFFDKSQKRRNRRNMSYGWVMLFIYGMVKS